jgi:uncharacterized protein YecE (DUF72 family)
MRRGGGYTPDEMRRFVEIVMGLAADRDVYIYFKHEDEPTGALNAVQFLSECSSVAQL